MHQCADTEKRRFYNLFYLGKEEREFHLFVIRFFFVINAVYTAVFCLHVAPGFIAKAFAIPAAIFLTCFGLVPPFLFVYFYMSEMVDLSVLVTSVEYFRDRRAIETVKRLQKEKRTVMLLRVIVALWDPEAEKELDEKNLTMMQCILDDPTIKFSDRMEATLSMEMELLSETFDLLDLDHSGSLNEDEIDELFKKFGAEVLPEKSEMFGSFYNDKAISKAEFLAFMYEKSQVARKYSAEHIAEFCFERWDKSGLGTKKEGNGQMSVEELQAGLGGMGQEFSGSEVSAIILKLDANGDGEFNEHEFEAWINMYSNDEAAGAPDEDDPLRASLSPR